jgi:hypothetical protein
VQGEYLITFSQYLEELLTKDVTHLAEITDTFIGDLHELTYYLSDPNQVKKV